MNDPEGKGQWGLLLHPWPVGGGCGNAIAPKKLTYFKLQYYFINYLTISFRKPFLAGENNVFQFVVK